MKVGNAIRPESRRSCIVNESAESVGRERERERERERQTDRETESERASKLANCRRISFRPSLAR